MKTLERRVSVLEEQLAMNSELICGLLKVIGLNKGTLCDEASYCRLWPDGKSEALNCDEAKRMMKNGTEVSVINFGSVERLDAVL